MATSQDGNYFSASTMDNVISVYDARTNKLLSATAIPLETNSQEWTAEGHLDVACGKKGSDGGMLVRFAVNPTAPVPKYTAAAVSSSSSSSASSSSSSSAAAATASSARSAKQAVVTALGHSECGLTKIAEIPVLAGAARVLSRSPDGSLIALAGVDSSVTLLDTATDTCVRSFDAGTGAVTAVDFSRDGCHLVVASRDSAIRIVRLCDGTTVRELAGTAASSVTAAWHPTRDLLAVISDDGASPTKLRVVNCA
jgi:WD40 repeat protein